MVGHSRILIIDDDENIREVLTTILQEEGYIVKSLGTAKDAIAETEKKFYNLALVDIRLPDMDGVRLLTKMKDTTPRMRKIIITGYPTLQNAVEAVNKGADAYVMKPFEMETVLRTIEEELGKQQKEQKFNQDKVASFIETRVRELEDEERLTQTTKS